MNTNTTQNTTSTGIAEGGLGERTIVEKGAGHSAAEGTGTGVGTTAGTGGIGTKIKYVVSQGSPSKKLTMIFYIEAHIM